MRLFKKKYPRKEDIQISSTDDNWSVGVAEGPDGPILLRVNKGYKDLIGHPEFKSWIFITTPYDCADNGMPTTEENACLEALEAEMEQALTAGNEALLCAVHTGSGRRMWLYYFSDFPTLQSRLDPIIQGSNRQWELPWDDDPEWRQYQQFL